MKKISLLIVVLLIALSVAAGARVTSDVNPYEQSLTAELTFWVPNFHGDEQFQFLNLPAATMNYVNDFGAGGQFSPSVQVDYQFGNSGLTFTYDYLSFGGNATTTQNFNFAHGGSTSAVPAGTPVSSSGYTHLVGLAYNFGNKHVWGTVGFKYFGGNNSLTAQIPGGSQTVSNPMEYASGPVENWLPVFGIGADIPVVPGRADLYGYANTSTPIIGSFYDAKLGLRVNLIEGLNANVGYRTLGWGSDLISAAVTGPFGMVNSGSVNYNGFYYGVSYYFY